MNVLHVISSGGMYGAEAVILNLSQALHEQPSGAHRSSLAAFTGPGQSNRELFAAAAAANVSAFPLSSKGPVDRGLPAALRALVRQTGADVVHAHGYKADLYSYLALRGGPVPLVSTCHTWYDNDFAVRFYGALDRWVLRSFDAVVAVSVEVEARLLRAGVPRQRVRVIRNGIAVRPDRSQASAAATRGELRVGLVGRLAPEKGVDLLLQAAALVRQQMPAAHFGIAGEGPDRAALETLRAELGLEPYVQLLGRVQDMPAFYASLDLLVSASRQEGLPVALLEGMAAGLPVVATTVGDVPALVQDGITGTLVPPANPHALAAAIVALLQQPERRKAFGAAARTRIAEEFSAARMAAEYLALYQQVLHSRGTAR